MPIDKIQVCEIGDMSGKPRQSYRIRRCKIHGCKTVLNSYHKGKYCHVHEQGVFYELQKTRPLISPKHFNNK